MAARVLAGLGADVVKVEGPARMDDWRQGTRGGPEGRYPDWEHGERPYNRNCQFNTQNTNKRALGLDLKSPAGQELAFELAAAADVVLTNFRSGYLARIGITHERLRERNPGLVIIEMPAYGGEGPIKDHVALGPSMEMMAGMASLVGYGDGKPVTTGPAYLDPIGAFNAAAAVVSALALREVTGQGSRVEVAQREAALHWIGEEILEAIECGCDRVPHGNRSAQASPHGAFPTAGVDQWVAIGVADEQQFQILAQLVDGLADARFATLESRKAHEDELEACVAAWTAGRDKFEVARLLQEAGVPAAPLMVADDLAASDFLSERGMLPTIDQPEVGARVHQGLPLHIDGIELGVRRPTPRFAEHNREILRDWLGLSGDPVEALYAGETLSDRPSAKGPTR
jgi:crotonobetainyl-CoA:carnitine CoA-transferase CaiB-like acyl-CoA transferase